MYCTPPANPTQLKRLFDRALPAVYPPTEALVTTTTSPVKASTLHLSTTQGISVTTTAKLGSLLSGFTLSPKIELGICVSAGQTQHVVMNSV